MAKKVRTSAFESLMAGGGNSSPVVGALRKVRKDLDEREYRQRQEAEKKQLEEIRRNIEKRREEAKVAKQKAETIKKIHETADEFKSRFPGVFKEGGSAVQYDPEGKVAKAKKAAEDSRTKNADGSDKSFLLRMFEALGSSKQAELGGFTDAHDTKEEREYTAKQLEEKKRYDKEKAVEKEVDKILPGGYKLAQRQDTVRLAEDAAKKADQAYMDTIVNAYNTLSGANDDRAINNAMKASLAQGIQAAGDWTKRYALDKILPATDMYHAFQASRHMAQRDEFAGLQSRGIELSKINDLMKDHLVGDVTKTMKAINNWSRGIKNDSDFLILANQGLLDQKYENLNQQAVKKYKTDNIATIVNNLRNAYDFLQMSDDATGLINSIFYSKAGSSKKDPFVGTSLYDTFNWQKGATQATGEAMSGLIGDDLENIKYHMYNKYNAAQTDEERASVLDEFNKRIADKSKEWQENYALEDDNYKMHDNVISARYKAEEANAQKESYFSGNFLHKLTYGTASTLGSSSADPYKSWTQQALTLALAFGTGGRSIGAKLAISGAAYGIGNSAAATENNAEVAQGVKDRFGAEMDKGFLYQTESDRKKGYRTMGDKLIDLYASDLKNMKLYKNLFNSKGNLVADAAMRKVLVNDINEMMFRGDLDITKAYKDVELGKAFSNATMGAQNLYEKDMIATAADNAIDVITAGLPLGKVLAGGKLMRPIRAAAYNTLGRSNYRVAAKGILSAAKGFGEGFEKSAALSPVAGAVTGTFKAVGRATGVEQRMSGWLGAQIGDAASAMFKRLSPALQEGLVKKYVISKGARNTLANAAKSFATRDISERIEEGKQQLNSELFTQGKLRGTNSLSENLFNDFLNGAESAKVALGMYIGQKWTDDGELFENIASVVPGGGSMHTAIKPVTAMYSAARQMSAADIVANNAFVDKEAGRNEFFSGINLSRVASSRIRSKEFNDAFLNIAEYNKTAKERGLPQINADDLEENRERFRRIQMLRHDSGVTNALAKQGIEKDSDKYHSVISLLAHYQKQGDEAAQNFDENAMEIARKTSEYVRNLSSPDGHISQRNTNEVDQTNQLFKQSDEELDGVGRAQRYQKQVDTLNEIAALQKMYKDLETDNGPVATNNRSYMRTMIRFRIEQLLNLIDEKHQKAVREDARSYLRDNQLYNDTEQHYRDKMYHYVDTAIANVVQRGMLADHSSDERLSKHERESLDLIANLNEYERGDRNNYISNEKPKFLDKVRSMLGYVNVDKILKHIDRGIDNDRERQQRFTDAYVAHQTQQNMQNLMLMDIFRQAAQEQKEQDEKEARREQAISDEYTRKFEHLQRKLAKAQANRERTDRGKDKEKVKADKEARKARREAEKAERKARKEEAKRKRTEASQKRHAEKYERFWQNAMDNQDNASTTLQLPTPLTQSPQQAPQQSTPLATQPTQQPTTPQTQATAAPQSPVSPAPQAAPAQPQVTQNKTVGEAIKNTLAGTNNANDDVKAACKQRIKDILAGKGKAYSIGAFVADLITAAAELGAIYVAEGTRTFLDFATQMIDDFGEEIVDYLPGIYKEVAKNEDLGLITEELDVDAADDYSHKQLINEYRSRKQVTLTPEQAAIKRVRDYIEWTAQNVMRDLTTGSHYFIRKQDGTIEMRERVHNAMPSWYSKQRYNKRTGQLVDDSERRGITAVVNKLRDLSDAELLLWMTDNKSQYPQIAGYEAYIQQEIDANRPLSRDEKYRIIHAVGEQVNHKKEDRTSLMIGNIFDDICRRYFASDLTRDQFKSQIYEQVTYKDGFGVEHYIKDPLYDDVQDNSPIVSKQLFDQIIDLLDEFKLIYKSQGWTLFTDPMTFIGDVQGVKLAGEPDMVAVDKNGGLHLVDFKTVMVNSKWNSFEKDWYEIGRQGIVNDLFGIPQGKEYSYEGQHLDMSRGEYYKRLLNIYATMMNLVFHGIPVVDMRLMFASYHTKEWSPTHKTQIALSHFDTLRDGENKPFTHMIEADTEIETKLRTYDDIKKVMAEFLLVYPEVDQIASETHLQEILQNTQQQPIRERAEALMNKIESIQQTLMLSYFDNSISMIDFATEQANSAINEYHQLYQDYQDELAAQAAAQTTATHTATVTAQQAQQPGAPATRTNRSKVLNAAMFNNFNWDRFVPGADKQLVEELKQLSSRPDFCTAGVFKLRVEPRRGYNNYYVSVTYNGKTYPEARIFLAHEIDDKGRPVTGPNGAYVLTDAAKQFEQNVRDLQARGVTEMILVDPRRTYGLAINTPDQHNVQNSRVLMDTFGGDLYNVVYHPGDSRVMVGKGDHFADASGHKVKSTTDNPAVSGHIYIAVKPNYEEEVQPMALPFTPVQLNAAKIGEENAKYLALLILYTDDIDDAVVKDGLDTVLTLRDVLGMFFPIARRGKSIYVGRWSIGIQGNYVNFISSNTLQAPGPFDLNSQQGRQAFVEAVSDMDMFVDEAMMRFRLNDQSDNNPFRKVAKYIKENGSLQIGQYKFEESDFKKSPSDNTSLSYLGWAMKNGVLTTSFDRLDAPLISFVNVAEAQETPVAEPAVYSQDQVAESQELDYESLFRQQEHRGALDMEKALRYIEKVFGKEYANTIRQHPDYIKDSIITEPNVVGAFVSDLDVIYLSQVADPGTEYHEAFHRVTNYLGDRQTVRGAFAEIRKRHPNVNWGFNEKTGEKLDDRQARIQLEEYLADDYMEYMLRMDEIEDMSFIPRNMYKLYNKIAMFVKTHFGKNAQTYKLYKALNGGTYRKGTENEKSKIRDIYYKKKAFSRNGYSFDNVFDSNMYDELLDFLAYGIFKSQQVDLFGDNIDQVTFDYENEIDTNLRKTIKMLIKQARGNNATTNMWKKTDAAIEEMLEKETFLNAVMPDLAKKISNFGARATSVEFEEDNDSDQDGGLSDADTGNMQVFQHEDYEFSRFGQANKKVKFFFSRIPRTYMGRDGKPHLYVNSLGLPEFTPASVAYNTALNLLHDCKDENELMERCAEYKKTDTLFGAIYQALTMVKAKGDANSRGLFNTIFNTLTCAKNKFTEIKASYDKDGWLLRLMSSSDEYSARNFTTEWGRQLMFSTNNPFIEVKDGKAYPKTPQSLKLLHTKLRELFDTNAIGRVMVNGRPSAYVGMLQSLYEYANRESADSKYQQSMIKIPTVVDGKVKYTSTLADWNNPDHLHCAKMKILDTLNSLGISLSVDELNYTLAHQFGSTGADAIYKFLNGEYVDKYGKRLSSGGQFLSQIVDKEGTKGPHLITYNDNGEYTINQKMFNEFLYTRNAFVKTLANYKYAYDQSHAETTATGIQNKKVYTMSDATVLHDITAWLKDVHCDTNADGSLNLATLQCPKEIEPLFKYAFCLDRDSEGHQIGSLVLKLIIQGNKDIQVQIMQGFKTEQRGDSGTEYTKTSTNEDYMTRATILANGCIALPVLSDKSTFYYISGVKLPGIDYNNFEAKNQYSITKRGNGVIVNYGEDVLSQIDEYAQTEFKACLQNLALDKTLKDSQKVINYDTKNKTGQRMITFNRIYVNGKWISFTQGTPEQALNKAQKEYFSKSKAERYAIMNATLKLLVIQEKKKMQEKGIITIDEQSQYKQPILEQCLISRDIIGRKLDGKETGFTGLQGVVSRKTTGLVDSEISRTALNLYIMDMVAKSIMSKCESERLFSGNPAFYKTQFNEEGQLVDVKEDQTKRFGGLSSTGSIGNLQGLPKTYKCAETANELVGSPQIEMLEDAIKGAVYREILGTMLSSKNIDQDKYNELINGHVSDIELYLKENISADDFKDVQEKAKAVYEAYKEGIDVADGAAYVSAEMYKNLLIAQGVWNNELEEAFEILNKDDDEFVDVLKKDAAYQKVFTTVIGNLKYTAFGFRSQKLEVDLDGSRETITRAIPYYNKMALFPLFKAVCPKGSRMRQILDKMQDSKDAQGNNAPIDMLFVNSAIKIGSQGCLGGKETSRQIDFATEEFNTYDQHYAYLRKQLNTDPNEKLTQAVGTQAMKVALSTLKHDAQYSFVDADGKKKTISGKELLDTVMSSINALSDIGELKLRDRFFKDGQLNQKEFSKFLKEQMSSRDASPELLKAIDTYVVDGEEQMRMPLAATSAGSFIESILASVVNKEVVEVATPGAPFIQRSVWGMEGEKLTLLSKDEYKGQLLKMINEEGTMDCMLSMDYFVEYEHGVPFFKLAGKNAKLTHADGSNMSFEEIRQWLIDNKVIGPNADGNIFGYRIPTQAISSIQFMRCLDVLPVVRDTVVLPKEFTRLTGSDFDIDKLFQSTMNYSFSRDESGNPVTSVNMQEFIEKKDGTKQPNPKFYQNRMLLAYKTALLDKDDQGRCRSAHEKYRSIDNDTKLVKDVLAHLEKDATKTEQYPFLFGTISEQTTQHDSLMAGKSNIGPFALNNNLHILFQLYGLKLNPKANPLLAKMEMLDLGKNIDRNSKSILSWFSALINGSVDMAKDPYLARLNVNSQTYNRYCLLLHLGFGDQAFYMLNQPIVKDMCAALNKAESYYQQDPTVSKSRRRIQAMIDVYRKYGFDDHEISILTDLKFDSRSEMERTYDEIKDAVFGNTFMDEDAKNPDKHTQFLAAAAYVFLGPSAQAISDMTSYTKIDTKKQGKSMIEQMKYAEGFNDLFFGNTSEKFLSPGLRALRSESFVGRKTQNAILLFSDILSTLTLETQPATIELVKQLYSQFSGMDVIDMKLKDIPAQYLKKFTRYVTAAQKSRFFNAYMEDNGINQVDLFVDREGELNSVASRLTLLKTLTETDPNYEHLRENALIKYLRSAAICEDAPALKEAKEGEEAVQVNERDRGGRYSNARFIRLYMPDEESNSQKIISEAWEDLLNDDNEEIQQFAKDLIVYSFLTSGDNASFTNFFKYVPASWRQDSGYASFIQSLITNRGECGVTVDEIMLNNIGDEDLIKTMSPFQFQYSRFAAKKGFPVVLAGFRRDNRKSSDTQGKYVPFDNVPMYVKIDAFGMNKSSNKKFLLYKFAGYGERELTHNVNGKQQTYSVRYPIYVKVEPNGMRMNRQYSISEYGVKNPASTELDGSLMQQIIEKIRQSEGQLTNEEMAEISKALAERNMRDDNVYYITGLSPQEDKVTSADLKDNKMLRDIVNYYKKKKSTEGKQYYEGDITPDDNTVFVFGSNPEGRHGKGAAKVAKEQFGAQYGVGEGLTGNAYALPTKDLRISDNNSMRSISPEGIIQSIKKLYQTARENPDKQFKVAYRNTSDTSLNGYTGYEMIDMFNQAGEIPSNVIFSKEWFDSGKLNIDYGSELIQHVAPVNIYAGTGENAELSNMATRPFEITDKATGLKFKFNSVEQAFHWMKAKFAGDRASMIKILNEKDPYQARRYGRAVKNLNVEEWDKKSTAILKRLMYLSYQQNPEAMEKLLATGNAEITHKNQNGQEQDNGRFSKLTMEIRDLLREDMVPESKGKDFGSTLGGRQATNEEEIKTIQSDKTILSNEELAYWNANGVGEKPRILVASERTDPAFHVQDILDIINGNKSVAEYGVVNGKRLVVGNVTGHDFAGLYLITKHDGLPMKQLLETKIPKLIHFSITGLGGTKYEPGVMKPMDLLNKIGEYIQQGLDPESVTIRIDPIVPGVTTPNMIRSIVKKASELGIKRIRFSIMDAYPNTVASMQKLGYDFENNYGINLRTGKINFTAKQETIDRIVDFMLKMKEEYGVSLGTCAEGLAREGISKEGCLSVASVNKMLGTQIEDKGMDNNDQRKLCSCYGGKIDALQYGKHCASHCVYCYARHENDQALLYYNEDGTLKDNNFTRTSNDQQQTVQNTVQVQRDQTPRNLSTGWGERKYVGKYDQPYITEYRRLSEEGKRIYKEYRLDLEDQWYDLQNAARQVRDNILAHDDDLVSVPKDEMDSYNITFSDGTKMNDLFVDLYGKSTLIADPKNDNNYQLFVLDYEIAKYMSNHKNVAEKFYQLVKERYAPDGINSIRFDEFGSDDFTYDNDKQIEDNKKVTIQNISENEGKKYSSMDDLYEYAYSDSRQQELFTNNMFDNPSNIFSEEEKKKAEEIKKHCKG